MKKILLASTAIVGFAGAASAELALSGSANMGIKYQENAAEEFFLHQEIDFNIVASGETDGGLTFGASVDLDTDLAGGNSGTVSDGEVFISGAFGTLTVGAVDAADDQYFGALEVGFDGIGLDDVAENGYGGGSHNVLYTYSMGGLSFAVSFNAASSGATPSTDDFAIGVQYDADVVTVALGYNETGAGVDVTSLEVSGSAGDLGYTVVYTDNSGSDAYGIGLTYNTGGMTISGGIADNDADTDASYGIGVAYGLGGGATLAGAIGSIDGETRMDFGINMSF